MGAVSLCAECDAPPGECSHGGARYLEPIVYEKVAAGGWRVPIAERERWELGPAPRYFKTPVAAAPDGDGNPFHCPECSSPLKEGRRYCSRACFLAAKARE